MDFDDDGLDDGPVAPLLPPEDRLWRHPSETAVRQVRHPRAAARDPRLVTVVALTSSISVLLTLGVVMVVRPVRTELAVERVAPPVVPVKAAVAGGVTDVATLAERLRSAVALVAATGAAGSARASGVVYRSDGLVLTTHRVVAGADTVRVTTHDGRTVPAKVVGSDPDTDIALLDADGTGYAVAPLGSASNVKAGQAAVALGTPASGRAGPVVSASVVSATGQAVALEDGKTLFDMIQTGAFAAGCAGGPVVDAAGVVIGIASVNVAGDGGASGYATPIDVARIVAAQLLMHGRVMRGWIGVEGDDLDAPGATQLGVDGGVVVKAVKPESPASAAGVAPADVITEIDGEQVTSMADLVVRLRMRRPGDTVALDTMRGGDARVVKVKLVEKP
ncbi:MAG TPA: trypsin-like peptidase domain-containing protein [Acidimicrobiales bacterium]